MVIITVILDNSFVCISIWYQLLFLLKHNFIYYLLFNKARKAKNNLHLLFLFYTQTLKLSDGLLSSITTGHVVTLMSSDTHKIQDVCQLKN